MANVGGAIHKDSALLMGRRATAVGGKAIGQRCVGPGRALLLDAHHHHANPTDREDHRAASHSSSRVEEEARAVASSSRKVALPTSTRKEAPPPKKTHLLKLVISKEETVSNRVGISGPTHPPEEKYSLSGPTHPPKEKYSLQTNTGKPCSNPFICYALGNGNGSEVDDSNKKYRVYTDTDSDGKTEIITDIKCKFKGKVFAMEVKV